MYKHAARRASATAASAKPHAYMRNVGLPGTPWSAKPSQQKSAKPHAQWRQAHAKLVPSKALFLPSWPRGPFLVWRKPALPRQAIAPSIPYIILLCEKRTRRPGRERGAPSILEFYLTDLVIGTVRNPGQHCHPLRGHWEPVGMGVGDVDDAGICEKGFRRPYTF